MRTSDDGDGPDHEARFDDLWPQITDPDREPERDFSFGDPTIDRPTCSCEG